MQYPKRGIFRSNLLLILASLIWAWPVPGLFSSAGAWTNKGPEDTNVYALAIDPYSTQTVYAGSSKGLYRSTNGGTNWAAIGNASLSISRVNALAIDPLSPTTIYAGTDNGILRSGVRDFNSDGNPDILWRNISTGDNYAWYLDGVTVLGGSSLPTVAEQNWTIVP
jgi:hypothetical protein